MDKPVITQLAEFVDALRFEDLPNDVVEESKRIILDSIGCAIGGITHDKGKIGLELPVHSAVAKKQLLLAATIVCLVWERLSLMAN